MKKLGAAVLLFVGCATVPALKTPPTVDELNAFGRVHTLMKAQGSMAQPLFKKTEWTDDEWAKTSEAVARLKVSSGLVKTKFPQDEQWVQLAEAVEKQLEVVDTAVQAKDAAGSKTAFADLRKSCNACHSKKYKVD